MPFFVQSEKKLSQISLNVLYVHSYFYLKTLISLFPIFKLILMICELCNKEMIFLLKITVNNNRKWFAVIIDTIFFLLKHYTITFPLVQSLTCEKV